MPLAPDIDPPQHSPHDNGDMDDEESDVYEVEVGAPVFLLAGLYSRFIGRLGRRVR
jgi:hypothetical protein